MRKLYFLLTIIITLSILVITCYATDIHIASAQSPSTVDSTEYANKSSKHITGLTELLHFIKEYSLFHELLKLLMIVAVVSGIFAFWLADHSIFEFLKAKYDAWRFKSTYKANLSDYDNGVIGKEQFERDMLQHSVNKIRMGVKEGIPEAKALMDHDHHILNDETITILLKQAVKLSPSAKSCKDLLYIICKSINAEKES